MKRKKVALILGANGGIGLEATKRLINDNFFVCAGYHKSKKNLNELKKVNKFSKFLSLHNFNVENEELVSKKIKRLSRKHDHFDVIILSMSPKIINTKILDAEWDGYQTHLEVQLKGLYSSLKALSDQIRSGHKTKFIVVLSEYCISNPPKGLSQYVASKYAAMGLAKSISQEVAEFGSTCNMISPGMVETDLLDNLPRKLIEINAQSNPLKRNANLDDISNLISYLASPKSDFINGANIPINGGKVII